MRLAVLALLACGCGRVGFMTVPRDADFDERALDAPSSSDGATDGGAPPLPWVRVFDATTAVALFDVATDPSGAVYVTGSFTGELHIGGDTHPSTGRIAAYLAAYEADGTPSWSRPYAGDDIVDLRAVALADDGTSYATGLMMGRAMFGATPIDGGLTQDLVILVHDRDGTIGRAYQYIGTGLGGDNAQGRAISLRGDTLFVAGLFGGDLDFGVTYLPMADDEAAFVAAIGTDGTARWARPIDGPGEQFGNGAALTDTACSAGQFDGTIALGARNIATNGSTDIYVVGYDAGGTQQWEAAYGAAGADSASSAAPTPDGGCVVVGYTTGVVSFGALSEPAQGGRDCFVLRLAANGMPRWVRIVGGPMNDSCASAVVDPAGRVFITGTFAGQGSFVGRMLTSAGGSDVFLLGLEEDGSLGFAESVGGAADESASAIALQPGTPGIVIGGSFAGATTIGDFTGDSGSVADMFVYRYLAP